MKGEGMKYFSTFTGIGGFEIGIENAYNLCNELTAQASRSPESDEDLRQVRERETVSALPRDHSRVGSVDKTRRGVLSADVRRERPVCVGYSEIDKYACSVYEYHNPGVKNYGDITKINAKELPDFDCLVGGFPCQAFSIAGKRRGFEDTRGTLFFDLARILREKQPRYFVFENVKGLLSHDKGNTFRTIITTIDELGYDCQWSVLNSKDFGVPQNRERVYIVGHLRGTPRPEVFPLAGDDREATELPGQYTNTLTARYEGAQAVGSYVAESELDAQSVKIPEATKKGYAEATIKNPLKGKTEYGWHFEQNVYDKDGLTRTVKAGGGSGNTLKVLDNVKIRRLTPIECERLQGFPDNWTAQGTDGAISDTQRYKMCGNAVTTNVVQAVFERIFAHG